MENLSGQVIKGYELRELIGEGGFGAVYLAHQRLIGREVAVKIILPQYANQPDFIRRFESEAQLIARLEHPHIVPLYDYWREPSGAYLVMRLVRGGSLANDIDKNGAWSVDKTVGLLNQIASALAIAHRQNIVHRDIKPENILLDENGNAYLSDFGIAKDLGGRQNITQKNAMVGSPAYISPEQIRGEAITPKADIYMLGMMVYEMLVGEHPFAETTAAALLYKHLSEIPADIHTIRSDIPTSVSAIIQRAMSKDVEERFNDVLDFASEFRHALRVTHPDDPHETVVVSSETLDLPEPENPYKGLRAFQQADAADFFGRESLVDRLVGRLKEEGKFSRFLAVVGPSGSGKSSVVKAGLLPALQRDALPGSQDWFIVEMVPGIDPMEELEAALLRIAVNPPDSLLHQLNEDERGFVRAVKRVLPGDEETELVLVIDQFEELFTLVEEETARQHLLDSIAVAVTDPRSRLRVIITLRADFYDRPLAYARFGELMQQRTEIVLPLSPEEIERAVVSPAERYHLALERGLVTAIVSDVQNQPGALPLLQYALTELFERRQGRALMLSAYHDIGGTMGALARRADELYENLDEDGEEAVRQMFLRLVTLGEGTEDTRRRVMQSELLSIGDPNVMRDVIDAFGRYRLLTFDHDQSTRSSTVEVAHEALIRQWGLLRSWLADSREDLRLQRRIAAATEEWTHSKEDRSFLARGARLDQFSELADNSRLTLNQEERAYLKASLTERQAAQEAEHARQEREDALEQRSRQRLQALVAVFAIATVVASILSLFAFTQNQAAQEAKALAVDEQMAAQEARDIAESQQQVAQEARDLAELQRQRAEQLADETQGLALAANARSALIERDPMLALALAIEANAAFQPAPREVTRVLANAAYSPGVKYRFTEHQTSVTGTALSADASLGVSVSNNGTMRVWNLFTGKAVWQIETDHLFTSVDYSLDGRYIITSEAGLAVGTDEALDDSVRGAVRLWDAKTGDLIRTFGADGGETHTESVMNITFSEDGTKALSGSLDRTLILWDVETGEAIRRIGTGEIMVAAPDGEDEVVDQIGAVLDVDMSADGRFAISGHADETILNTTEDYVDRRVRVWDLETGALVARLEPKSGFARAVALNADGSRALSGTWDSANGGFLSLWDVASLQEIRRIYADTDIISAVDFSQNGQIAISAGWSLRLQLFDLNTGVQISRFEGFPDRLLSVAYSRDGQYVLIGSGNVGGNDLIRTVELARDTSVWLIDLRNRAQVKTFTGHQDWVWTMDISPDGKTLATGSGSLNGVPVDSTVRLWDIASGGEILKLEGHTGTVDGVAFSPDGSTVLSGGWDAKLILWDATSGAELRRFVTEGSENAHGDRITSVAFSPDGTLALSSAVNGEVHLWDMASGNLAKSFVGHTREVSSVAFSPDGLTAVTGAADNLIIMWDVATGEIVRQIEGHTGQVNNVIFSPDAAYLVSTSWDGTVRLWDAATGEHIRNFVGHSGAVFAAGFSPDGELLLTAGRDQVIRMWDVKTGEELRRFEGHTNWVQMLEFSPDGRFVISAAQDNTARQWRIDRTSRELLSFVDANRYRRPLTCGERGQYRLGVIPECQPVDAADD